MGSLSEEESLKTWSKEKCLALVREITFANAEELTDEGLPFLILFHRADDHQSVALFEKEVAKQLLNERSSFLSSLDELIDGFCLSSEYQLFTC